MDLEDWEGKTALVTGADHGLGAALSGALAERGCTVFAGRYRTAPDRLDEILERHPKRIIPLALDVSSNESVLHALENVAGQVSRIDLLINNAAILGRIEPTIPGPVDFDDVLGAYNVNAVGPLRMVNAFFPSLLAGGVKIVVNISSEAGSVGTCGRDGWYAYCMSKSALNMASALIHNRIRPLGGKVIVVHPGWMKTWMRGALDMEADLFPEQSAAGILALIDRALAGDPIFGGERPAFIDVNGIRMPW
jgi:NAD(P)-dependent dehydrogenase (short-subunit alcohol dehydrogenase family)